MNFCERLNSSTSKSSIYPVQFNLKSRTYDARMHFIAGNPQLANDVLREHLNDRNRSTELKITQRHRLDQQKLDDMDKKVRTNVSHVSSKSTSNGQSSSSNTSLANQTNFAILITSPNQQFSSDENDESSLSNLISYLTR